MHIAVAGNIGCGKTTLTNMLAKHYGWEPRFESVEFNPYLEDFYADMGRWSFNLQVYFLNKRFKDVVDISNSDKFIIQDRTIYEDAHIFAYNLHEMGLISSRDFATYMKIFHLTTNLVPQPDVLIYLRASIPTLVAQIKRRGRAYEMNIDEQYLSRLNEKYEAWINEIYKGRVLIIDKDVDDFVADPTVVDRICEQLDAMTSKK